jgi:Terpene cyclase DEP1
MKRMMLISTLALFSTLSVIALYDVGYWGIVAPHFQSFGAGQVFADLVIALTLVVIWMWRDAKSRGRSPWSWIALTLVAGSIGPLVYLLLREEQILHGTSHRSPVYLGRNR